MRWYSKIVVAGLCASLQACVTPPAAAPAPPSAQPTLEARPPVTILISIDGFRSDYLSRGVTPHLNALAAGGISAVMHPSFPSKTFPNHWALVTGLRPDRNGVVSNSMEDARRPGETFTMATDDPFWWSEAKPIWVDAEQAGIHTGTMFWPGANVAWGGTLKPGGHGGATGGTRPEDWMQFNQAVTGAQRVAGVLDWMRRPATIRPRFVTLYFDTVDSAGHAFGPDDAHTTAAAGDVDTLIGTLVDGLRALGQPANLVIVADHGMAATSSERTIAMDKIANPADYRIFETGPFASLSAVPGHEAALEKALFAAHEHLHCWRKADIPARFHYGTNPRVQPYFCLADAGWETAKTTPDKLRTGGDHGYDNMAPEMNALFIANGPAIRQGRLAPFDNVDVYPLLRDLLALPPATGVDGDDAPFRTVLKR
jgi:predicted AlkP superfamily pyrophosphatase or phosphodiesterase